MSTRESDFFLLDTLFFTYLVVVYSFIEICLKALNRQKSLL